MPTPFPPPWNEVPAPEGSWRAIFKWGARDKYKHPNRRLSALLKRRLRLADDDLRRPRDLGLDPVNIVAPSRLSPEDIHAFQAILGDEGVSVKPRDRLEVAYGKTMLDLMRLRARTVENLPEAVLYPRDRHDVVRIVAHCAARGIPLTPYGGGSSVTRGVECLKGGVSLDLRRHMNKVVRFNEVDQTITVEPGLMGPDLEATLNNAPQLLGARRRYTCGHFPQSFEFSSVGGWAATRGAGQNSTYYGKIEDIVISQEMVTPAGILRTQDHPAAATGPDTDQILLGSEGAFGVITSLTLKVFRYRPENTRRFSYMFPDWESACLAAREVLQDEGGRPSVFRLSDSEETDVALKLYGVEGPVAEAVLGLMGMKPGRRCLLLGSSDGSSGYARQVRRSVSRIARAHGGFSLTGLVAKSWEHGRFKDPYLRDDLMDFGILIDTLECSVTWDTLSRVHEGVRAFCHTRPDTVVMCHMSHCYQQGANLYFIFIARMDSIEEYKAYQAGILDAIRRLGATMSHHHGIGKMTAPWLEGQIGRNQLELFRAIKRHLDPGGIMNPGGTLALDLPDGMRRP